VGTPSLNPALEDLHHCPRCGKPPEIDFPRSISCPHCGYAAFYNPKPVACAITHDAGGDVLLIKRRFPPGEGKWSIPGGFVDLGESVEDAARRELKEELDVEIEITGLVGVYSRPDQRTVVVVYAATTRGTPVRMEEALDVRAFAPTHIPWQTLAFWSDERALRHHLNSPPGRDGSQA
jgi:ADP-ribose pyrophosphatase YjhB (NUDIX family)